MNPMQRNALMLAAGHSVKKLKSIRSVSIMVDYGEDGDRKQKTIHLDADAIKSMLSWPKRYSLRKQKALQPPSKEVINMADYQFKVIWLNEMGEEQSSYHDDKESRDAKMQALADDGYSPVFEEA